MIFGKDYKDLDKFLDTMYRRIRFFTPFTYPTLKNSPWKMCAILSVILISPIPNCILIYEQNDQNFALKLLQFSEMILIIAAETMSFITVAYVARNLESIHRKVNFIHAIFRRKNAPIYSSSCHVKHDLSFLLMILLYMTPQLVYKWITNSNEHKGNQILEWLSTAIPVVVVHQLASIFRLVISILSVQLSNLNQLLKTADPRKPQEIEFLVYGHCLINQTFKLLNSSFAIPMIAMSFCTFFIVVYNFYDMLTFNSTQEISQTIGDNLGGITWIIMWTSELIVVVVLLEKLNERVSLSKFLIPR
ncbi:unnamed protein product [Nesidiocoris tenuis]|uniref:Gustatory receptor n=1 Tax=Nesidiocoris tenuis TaxID=355587 RepID=A0A6H5HF19_9HEMI|nr:unnamed protein product [Nesidiocoris tenuis]